MHLSLMPLFNTFTQLSSWAFVSVLEDHGSALPAWTWHLRIWWNSRFLFPDPFRFGARMNVSFKARVTIHQSIPQPSRPSSPGKCHQGAATMAVRVQPESMPVPPVPTMMPADPVDPVVQIPYHELPGKTTESCFGWVDFLHLTTWFTATNFSGSWKIDLSLFSGWKYVKHHL